MALTKNQKDIINSIKGEFERINAQSSQHVGTFFDIGDIKSEFNRKQQAIEEIKLSNKKFREVANEMAKADFKLLKPDFDALNIPITLVNGSDKGIVYRVRIGLEGQSLPKKYELCYYDNQIFDDFAKQHKTIGIVRKCYFSSNANSSYTSLEKFVEALKVNNRIQNLYEVYNQE